MSKIVATVRRFKEYNNFEEVVDNLYRAGVDFFRFNISKANNSKQFIEVQNDIQDIKNRLGENVKIMIDIPYPGIKPRINGYTVDNINRGEVIIIRESNVNIDESVLDVSTGKKMIFVDRLDNDYKQGGILVYSNGEGAFEIKEKIADKCYEVRALNTFIIKKRKSLMNRKRVDNYLDFGILNDFNCDYIACSFTETPHEMDFIRKQIKNKSIKLIAKIESQSGVNNISEIAKSCDGLMIARGDLAINTDIRELLLNERRICSCARENNIMCIAATEIGSSLVNNYLPSRSDIIDMLALKEIGVDYAITNLQISISDNVQEAIQMMNRLIFDN